MKFLKELKEQQAKSKKLYGEGYKRNFITERLHKNKENYLKDYEIMFENGNDFVYKGTKNGNILTNC